MRKQTIATVEEKFRTRHVKQADGCWRWTGQLLKVGDYRYPVIAVRSGEPAVQATRWAYEKWIGPIPKGGRVLRRCEFSLCVNPEHLQLQSKEAA